MNRIENAFKDKPIFMPYFPLGYPDLDTSIDVIEALAKNGADLIEVDVQMSQDGIPFLRHNYQLPDERWCRQLPWKELKDIVIDKKRLEKIEVVPVKNISEVLKFALDWKGRQSVLRKILKQN